MGLKLIDWFKKWNLDFKLNLGIAEIDLEFDNADKNAAWELYTELLTRITTQPLPSEHGDEQRALTSVYEIFSITREIIKKNGYKCVKFTKVAIIMLNQAIRPFTANWHKLSLHGAFDKKKSCKEFRKELAELQKKLSNFTKMLAAMIGVEDLTILEPEED